jgi:membrane protein DedA with SNARE-associated domain
MGAMLVGFGMGRRGGPLLTRIVSPQERAAAERLLARWGVLAILVTRPVPLLAETVAVLAGASSLGWRAAMLAALAGSSPIALIYALTGAAIVTGSDALVFAAVVGVAGGAWLARQVGARWLVRNRDQTVPESPSGIAS